MATTSKYYVLTPNGDNLDFLDFGLNYGSVTTVGQSVQYNGSSKVDSVFVRPGFSYDLTNTAAGQDKIYLGGNLADYNRSISGDVLTLSRTVGSLSEEVKVARGTALNFDNFVFANGTVSAFDLYRAVEGSVPLPTPNPSEVSGAPLGAAAPGAALNANVRAYSSNIAPVDHIGETFASTLPGINLTVNGGAGIDTVYVANGETVDARVLGGSVDQVYLRGSWADYTKTMLSSNTQILLTRSIAGVTESVTVTAGTTLNYDKLIFADGAANSFAARDAIVANPSGPLAAVAGNDPKTTTPLYSDADVAAALATIRDAAQNNTATPNTPAASVYASAGVTGVGTSNLGAINSALNSGPINGNAADTTAEVQAIVNAYQAILNSADGIAGNTATPFGFEQYAAIGVTVPRGPALGGGSSLPLLNDVVDGKPMTAVDTVTELQALLDAAHHVEMAAGGSAADIAGLTLADLQLLGVTGVTASNLPAVLAAIGAASADLSVVTLARLQEVVGRAGNVVHTASAPLDGVLNLDVTSNLVFSVGQSVTVGTGFIHITDLGGSTASGGTGYHHDTATNTQTIDVATAVASGVLSITGTGANTKIIINPKWDLDLSSSYQVSIDDGAFLNATGTQSAGHFNTLSFSTVTPGVHTTGSAASEASVSQSMSDATGAMVVSKSWLDIEGIGNNSASMSQLGDLAGGSFALVMKNYATTPGGAKGDRTDGISAHDTNIGVQNFGNNDIVYFDSQVNNLSQQLFDAHYTSMTNGADRGGLVGQNTLVIGLTSTPAQFGSTAMVSLGLEGNAANTVYPAVYTLDANTPGWANAWHNSSTPLVMG